MRNPSPTLRDYGFEIVSRPRSGPNLWRRGKHGRSMTETEALVICDRLAYYQIREQAKAKKT